MNLIEKEIQVNQHIFTLTNQRALIWKDESALILSDLHLGKTAHFRKNGIALPVDLIQEDLKRLSKLIEYYQTKKLIIVGDFLHAGKNSEFDIFKEWKTQFLDLKIILIRGNHDRISNQNLLDLGIAEVHKVYQKNDILFSHENIENIGKLVISGHIHPGISIKSNIKKHLKFPCFIKTESQIILPAFSSFTGLDTKNHPENPSYYFFTDEGIYEL